MTTDDQLRDFAEMFYRLGGPDSDIGKAIIDVLDENERLTEFEEMVNECVRFGVEKLSIEGLNRTDPLDCIKELYCLAAKIVGPIKALLDE